LSTTSRAKKRPDDTTIPSCLPPQFRPEYHQKTWLFGFSTLVTMLVTTMVK
jgi:hypothetical protein